MPEFIKFLAWAGALGAAVYYLFEEVRPYKRENPTPARKEIVAQSEQILSSLQDEKGQAPAIDRKSLEILVLAQLAGESREVPGNAAEFFTHSDHPDLMKRTIVEAINHSDPLIRRNAAEVAGLMRIEQSRPALEGRVQDRSKDVQRSAVNSLKYVGTSDSFFALVLALKSPHWETRMEAAEALGLHGGPQAVRYLWTALNDAEPLVRELAALSILKAATQDNLTFLNSKLTDPTSAKADIARRAIDAIDLKGSPFPSENSRSSP